MDVSTNQTQGQGPILAFLHDSIRICLQVKEFYLDPLCSYSLANLVELIRCIPPNVTVFGSRAVREYFMIEMTNPDDSQYMTIYGKSLKL